MALVVVGSAKGSPGATTTALALAALWPREVLLVDADPIGGDVAVRMPAAGGEPLDADRGLVSLAAAARFGLTAELLLTHAQTMAGGLEVLAGLRGPEQAVGLEGFWPQLAAGAAALAGADVVADVGRLGHDPSVLPLVRAAHLVVLVARLDVASVVHLRERIGGLAPQLAGPGGRRPPLAVVLVGPARDGAASRAARDSLSRTATPPDRVWGVAHDPRGASVFDGATVRRPERTDLARSVASVAAEAADLVAPSSLPVPPAGPRGPGALPAERGSGVPLARSGRDERRTDARHDADDGPGPPAAPDPATGPVGIRHGRRRSVAPVRGSGSDGAAGGPGVLGDGATTGDGGRART